MSQLNLDARPLEPWELASCETCDAEVPLYPAPVGWYVCKDCNNIERPSDGLIFRWVLYCPECAARLDTVKYPTKVCSCGQRIKPYEGSQGFQCFRSLVIFCITAGAVGVVAGFLF